MVLIGRWAIAVTAAAFLCSCVAHEPSLLKGTLGSIPGKDTAGLEPDTAREKVLHETAKIAVDHGYRYFTLLASSSSGQGNATLTPSPVVSSPRSVNWPITPGVPMRFRLLRDGEGRKEHLQKWDAYALLRTPAPDTNQKP